MEKRAKLASGIASPSRRQGHVVGIPPIVGIGASAGGLEALQAFFAHMPASSGLAFVVVQHLDPTCEGMMPELLHRATQMPVVEAGNRMLVRPDCVYVIPPNKDLSLLHGRLHLIDLIAPRGLRLPIDFFFRTLADDQRERAICVILSGMGSDGSLGMRAIKEKDGLALVQKPESAKFDSMPRSAINTGLVDIIAPAEELAGEILAYFQHFPNWVHLKHEPMYEPKTQSALEKIEILLRERSGNDFSMYKKNILFRRIERRMGLHQIDTISNYVRYLRESPKELDLLFKELLIGVTSFFRDPAVWEAMKTEAFPALLAAYPDGRELRAWVPACSTGEEAYSLAMVFKEALERVKPKGRFTLQIFATDLDQDAINQARRGRYLPNIAADVSPERLSRFFVEEENGYRISKEIRAMVIFAPQNIIMDPPYTRLDILSCRNLLIYLGQKLQKNLISLFHTILTSHGILLLGNSESINSFSRQFTSLDRSARIYERIDNPLIMPDVVFPTGHFPLLSGAEEVPKLNVPIANLQALADRLLLKHCAPAAVLVTSEGEILYINGHTGKYLEPAAGKANWNIHAMVREGLRHELAKAMKMALQQPNAVNLNALNIDAKLGTQAVNLSAQAIDHPEALRGTILIVFTDVASVPNGKLPRNTQSAVQKSLMAELQQARDEIQAMREEMQNSQEEVRSAREELQSTNEDLQSINEELTTTKEELLSLNEELQTINAELQSKVDNLSWVNNDMKSLLNSTEIAAVFLDNALYLRRYTPYATHLFKLIPGDIGRSLSDIVTDLDYEQLQHDAMDVLTTLIFVEKRVSTHDGRWFEVRIMPYRTQENVIDGVTITFFNITHLQEMGGGAM